MYSDISVCDHGGSLNYSYQYIYQEADAIYISIVLVV